MTGTLRFALLLGAGLVAAPGLAAATGDAQPTTVEEIIKQHPPEPEQPAAETTPAAPQQPAESQPSPLKPAETKLDDPGTAPSIDPSRFGLPKR